MLTETRSPCRSAPPGPSSPLFSTVTSGRGARAPRASPSPRAGVSHLRTTRPVPARDGITALCPHAAGESRPRRARSASRQPGPLLPSAACRHIRQPPALLERMRLVRRVLGGFLWSIWASWLQKEKPGLISPLPELHTALQALCVGSDAVERGSSLGAKPLTAAHTLCAGSTALLSTFPPPAAGTGTGMGTGTPEAHRDRCSASLQPEHRQLPRALCVQRSLLADENSPRMLPRLFYAFSSRI